MTMNYNLGVVETKPMVIRKKWNEEAQRYEDDLGLIETRVEWVSHGNYALCQRVDGFQLREDNNCKFFPYIWMELEAEYFDQILTAIDEKPLPTTAEESFSPFWQAVLPRRGMSFFDIQLRAYFWGKQKKGFLLHQQHNNPFFGGLPCPKIDEMGFNVEDFRKIRDIAMSAGERPVHYCVM